MRIGIDLDNTIINYDGAFHSIAQASGLIPAHFSGSKQELRDIIRMLPDGEMQWQRLQGAVYGKGIMQASLFDGVERFILEAGRRGHELFIASHKTAYGHYDVARVNLREAALEFLEQQGLFSTMGFPRDQIYFFPTRREKVNAIATFAPSWFIDDLVELYQEPDFPSAVRQILFHRAASNAPAGCWHCFRNWQEIYDFIFA